VENILEEFVIEDDDLKDRLADLRIHVLPRTKLTNVIQKNETLQENLTKAYREINRLRKVMIDPFSMHRPEKGQKRRAQQLREFTVDLEDNKIVINYKDDGKDQELDEKKKDEKDDGRIEVSSGKTLLDKKLSAT